MMIRINTVAELRNVLASYRKEGKTIGFVPTMGFLHEGHGALMKRARQECDVVVVSVFVNPTQFGPNEDFDAYPRNEENDQALMEEIGVDVAFFPSKEELYPSGYQTFVDLEGNLTKGLCGASRPGHFKGVATIVAKLFNMVLPHKAYFGQKDAQQVAVIKRMVMDLNMPVEIVPCPIVREADGLAMSSRNTYLNSEERKQALVLSSALRAAQEALLKGERKTRVLKELMKKTIGTAPLAQIDYIEWVNPDTLEPLDIVEEKVLVALAVRIGKTRLIDNCVMEATYVG